MRLAAQLKGGFYPAAEEAIAHAATFLCPPVGDPFSILDPWQARSRYSAVWRIAPLPTSSDLCHRTG